MKKFVLIQLLNILISLNIYSKINLEDKYKILWNDLKNHNTIGYKGKYFNCFMIGDVYVKKLNGQPSNDGFGKTHQGFQEMNNIKINETIIRMIFILEKLKKQKADDQNDYDIIYAV